MMNRRIDEATWLKTRLIEQLTYWDDQRMVFMDTYFPANETKHQERSKIDQFIQRYIQQLEHTVALLGTDHDENQQRRAWIGSRIEIQDLDGPDTETFTLCLPSQSDPDSGAISFLSPIGLELTLAQEGDELTLHTPAGNWPVRLKKIDYLAL